MEQKVFRPSGGSSNQLQDKNSSRSLAPPTVREPLHKDKSQNLQTIKLMPMKFNSPPAVGIEVTLQGLLYYMNSSGKVPLFVLLPELQRLLIGDRNMELSTLTILFENDKIATDTFIREIATLAGRQMLARVIDKMLQQAARGEVPGQHNMQFPLNVQIPALTHALDMNDIYRALDKDTFQWRKANIQDQIDKNDPLNCPMQLAASPSTVTHKAVFTVSRPTTARKIRVSDCLEAEEVPRAVIAETQPNATAESRAATKRRVSDHSEVPHVSHGNPGPFMPVSCSRTAPVELQSQNSCSDKGLEGVTLKDLQNFYKNLCDNNKIQAQKVITGLKQKVKDKMKSLLEEVEMLRIENKTLMEQLNRKDSENMELKEKLSEAKKQMEEAEFRGKLNYLSSEEHKEEMRSHAKRMKPSVEELLVSPEGQAYLSSRGVTHTSVNSSEIYKL